MPLNKPAIDFNAFGALIEATIIPAFELDAEDEKLVAEELAWLFSAADNLLKICQKEILPNQPISIPIPTSAEKTSPEANNQLLTNPKALISYASFEDMLWGKSFNLKKQLESLANRFNTYLRGLDILLDRESKLGEAGKSDIPLQENIRSGRIEVIKVVRELAELINNTYGIKVTSPDQLIGIM
jgi:hypothetical protein